MVFRIREIIYTLLLLFLGIILIICLVMMFSGSEKGSGPGAASGETTDSAGTDAASSETTDSTGTGAASGETTDSAGTDAASAESAASIRTGISSDGASNAVSAAASADSAENTVSYIAGVYLASVSLGNSAAEVEVTVDTDRIRAVRLTNLTEEMEEEYPLISSSMNALSEQILEKQSLSEITAPAESRYTSQLLLNAVSKALETARE